MQFIDLAAQQERIRERIEANIATGEVISLLGATRVFVDIDPRTFNLYSSKLESAIQAVMDN